MSTHELGARLQPLVRKAPGVLVNDLGVLTAEWTEDVKTTGVLFNCNKRRLIHINEQSANLKGNVAYYALFNRSA